MASYNSNKIYLIESLEGQDKQMASDLFNYTIKPNIDKAIEEAEYIEVKNKDEFLQALNRILDDVKNNGKFPYIHIEAHGDEKGIGLIDDDGIDWPDFTEIIKEINIASRNNLFISMAACYGGYIVSTAATELYHNYDPRAPFFGFVGPTETIYPSELESGFKGWFRELLQNRNTKAALLALNKESQYDANFEFNNCEGLFLVVAKKFGSTFIANRMKYMHKEPQKYFEFYKDMFEWTYDRPFAITDFQTIITSNDFYTDFLNKKREHFYMIDLYPDNDDRFKRITGLEIVPTK